MDDPWVVFAGEMAEEFFRNHRETMPEDPHAVWNVEEVVVFCLAASLAGAKFNWAASRRESFIARENQLLSDLYSHAKQGSGDEIVLLRDRLTEYDRLFSKGANSFFSAITGSICKKAARAFVEHACKRYIYPEHMLVAGVDSWLVSKWREMDKTVAWSAT